MDVKVLLAPACRAAAKLSGVPWEEYLGVAWESVNNGATTHIEIYRDIIDYIRQTDQKARWALREARYRRFRQKNPEATPRAGRPVSDMDLYRKYYERHSKDSHIEVVDGEEYCEYILSKIKNDKYREVFRYRTIYGLMDRELAEKFRTNVDNIYFYLGSARRELKAKLKKEVVCVM